MPADQTFRFQFSVSVCDRGAMDAEHLRQFPAGGNAVAGTQIARMDQGAQLVAQLNVEGNVTFGLKV